MNPFNFESQTDIELLEIANKLFKQPENEDLLKKLLHHLPNIDLESDIPILAKILKMMLPSKNIVVNDISNRMVYFILKKAGKESLDGIAHIWLYYNFNAVNKYKEKILAKYFNVQQLEEKLYEMISRNNESIIGLGKDTNKNMDLYDHNIEAFIYLLENSEREYYLNIKIEMTGTAQLLRILRAIGKNTAETSHTKLYSQIHRDLLELDAHSDMLQVEKKYKILCTVYEDIPETIYEDFQHLSLETEKLILKLKSSPVAGANAEKLKIANSKQLELILPFAPDKEKLLLENKDIKINIIGLVLAHQVNIDFVKSNLAIFQPSINHYITKLYNNIRFNILDSNEINCNNYKDKNETLSPFLELFAGKERIYLLWMLDKTEDPAKFSKKDIEEAMECSVDVFPRDYFLSNEFDCDAVPFIRKYGGDSGTIAGDAGVNVAELMKRFKKTNRADLVFYVSAHELIKDIVLGMPIDEVNAISKKLEEGKKPKELSILSTLLFYRKRTGGKNLDFKFILENLLNLEFLLLVLSNKDNRSPFIREVMLYIDGCPFQNTVYFTGFNFDDDSQFFYNLETPTADKVILTIFKVFNKLKNLRIEDSIFLSVAGILLFRETTVLAEFRHYFECDARTKNGALQSKCETLQPAGDIVKYGEDLLQFCDNKTLQSVPDISSLIANMKISKSSNLEKNALYNLLIGRDSMFYLKTKPWLIERLLREIYSVPPKYTLNLLNINRNKSFDILLRANVFDIALLPSVNTNYLSPEGLRSWIKLLLGLKEASGKIAGTDELSELVVYKDCLMADTGLATKNYLMEIGYETLEFLERDSFLCSKILRPERIQIYEPVIQKVSALYSQYLVDTYSFSKLEANATQESIFELLVLPIAKFSRMFWKILVNSLHLINNIDIPLFIEKVCLGNLIGKTYTSNSSAGANDSSDNLGRPAMSQLLEYLLICTKDELSLFSFVFPTLSSRIFSGSNIPSKFSPKSITLLKSTISLRSILTEISKQKIQNTKLTFVEYPGSRYQIELKYKLDSISYDARFIVPISFPDSMPTIEFDHEKCPKLFRKLNELLKTSTKFVEIFMLLKMNLDSKIEGYSECPICYYIIEPKTRTLADFDCDVCKNRFHKKCIFEWAKSSKNTKCPLCRSEIPIWAK